MVFRTLFPVDGTWELGKQLYKTWLLSGCENEWVCNKYDTISFGFGELEALELFCEASLNFLVTH